MRGSFRVGKKWLALSTLFLPWILSRHVQLVKYPFQLVASDVVAVVSPSAVFTLTQHCRPVAGMFCYMFMVSRSLFIPSEEYNFTDPMAKSREPGSRDSFSCSIGLESDGPRGHNEIKNPTS